MKKSTSPIDPSLTNQRGQTSVEYILMIVVMIAVGSSVFGKLEEYFVSNPDSFVNQYLETYRQSFGNTNGGVRAKYRQFKVTR